MGQNSAKGSAQRVAKALEAHVLVALIFGALIYILALTGTLSVFNHELQRWEQPDVPEMLQISAEAAERAALAVFASEAEPSSPLYINFPQGDLPRTVITTDTQAFFAAPDGSIAGPEAFPWTQFLLDLHYYLHLPQILGLTVVGALGAMLIGLSFSGLLARPRIFRDAFTYRRGAGRLPTASPLQLLPLVCRMTQPRCSHRYSVASQSLLRRPRITAKLPISLARLNTWRANSPNTKSHSLSCMSQAPPGNTAM